MVSAVGFGGIPIQRLSDEQAVTVVRHCLDLGVTFLDTANAYITSEERIGRAISGRRQGLVLATKTQARDAEGVIRHLELSLERLGVSTIDLYQFHCVSTEDDFQKIIAPGGPLDAVMQAQLAGQVAHVGLSSHSLEIALEAVKSGYFETIMFPFNLVASEAAQELIPLAEAEDVGFIAMKPLAGGALSEAGLAFKYLRQFPGILPIPGIEHAGEMDEIVALMKGPAELSSAEQAAIQRMRAELGSRFCRRCGYCEPCPQGVPTQALMILDSMIKRMPASKVRSDFAQAVEKAEACTECGECEEKCPYGLPIPEMINEHVALYHREMARHQAP